MKALVVDDERLARESLAGLLLEFPHIDRVEEADGLESALAAVRRQQPDAVFLDVQLGAASGFDVAERLPVGVPVIFVTAYDQYALRAFEVNALDYLLKPVRRSRLSDALARLQSRARHRDRGAARLRATDVVFLETFRDRALLRVDDIACVLSQAPYSEVVAADGRRHLVRRSLRQWETRLPENGFVRVHRAAIVNLSHIEAVEPWFRGTYRLRVRGLSDVLDVSRRASRRLRRRL